MNCAPLGNMPNGVRVAVTGIEFAAAHRLEHYDGKCNNLHGHNYRVDVVVQGYKKCCNNSMVMDFGDLKGLIKNIVKQYDHKNLNDICGPDPTAEGLAISLFHQLSVGLTSFKRDDLKLCSVRVWETSGNYAEAIGE